MKRECAKLMPGLVALAHGEDDPAARAHVSTCPACASVLRDLEEAVTLLKSEFADAPADAISAAKSLFPRATPVHARLVTSTLSSAGARGGEAFQSSYEFEGGSARVMYRPEPEGWRVLARVEGQGWTAHPEPADDMGRIEFLAANLREAEIRLTKAGAEVIIDPPAEAQDDR